MGLLHSKYWLSTRVIFFALLICALPNSCAGESMFSPQFKAELKSGVATCLKFSRDVDCSDGPHGPMGEWDVSSVADMSAIFMGAASFDGGISKWDVSKVEEMNLLFAYATQFNGDISKWDVSSVTSMNSMFKAATSFKGDISKWDVSSVSNMPG